MGVEKRRAARKHFEASVEKREPREHFSASAYGLGFKNLSLGSLFSTEASKCLRVVLLFSTKMPWDKSNYTRIIFSVEFKPEQLFQQHVFLDFLVFLWTFWPLLRINET